jgi:hypothetical protein
VCQLYDIPAGTGIGFFQEFHTSLVLIASFRKHSYKRGTGFFIDLAYQGKDRIARPVTEHLVCQRFANFWNVFLWISCPIRNCSPTIFAPAKGWIVEKDEEVSQMWPSKVGGVKWWKRKTTKHLEDYYRTPKKVFESLSIAFMVQRWFVDHKVALI